MISQKIKNVFASILYKLGFSYRFGKLRRNYNTNPRESYYGKRILTPIEGNKFILESLKTNEPFLVSRLGSSELNVVLNYLAYKGKKVKWNYELAETLKRNAGFFPIEAEYLKLFSETYLNSIKQVNSMGIWFFIEGEEEICKAYCPDAALISPESLEPYYHKNPWSQALEGKKVLVIHPFEESIRFQYNNRREKLFHDDKVLPHFELKTLRAVQSIAGNHTDYKSWQEALHDMCESISKIDFDIAIIGAGAYGLPLGAYIKSLGKKAIHMGGATQILFGIKGKRWEENSRISKLFNDQWKFPEPSEKPKNSELVENACYW